MEIAPAIAAATTWSRKAAPGRPAICVRTVLLRGHRLHHRVLAARLRQSGLNPHSPTTLDGRRDVAPIAGSRRAGDRAHEARLFWPAHRGVRYRQPRLEKLGAVFRQGRDPSRAAYRAVREI